MAKQYDESKHPRNHAGEYTKKDKGRPGQLPDANADEHVLTDAEICKRIGEDARFVEFDLPDGHTIQGWACDDRRIDGPAPRGWHLYSVMEGEDDEDAFDEDAFDEDAFDEDAFYDPVMTVTHHGERVNHRFDFLTRDDLGSDPAIDFKGDDWGFTDNPIPYYHPCVWMEENGYRGAGQMREGFDKAFRDNLDITCTEASGDPCFVDRGYYPNTRNAVLELGQNGGYELLLREKSGTDEGEIVEFSNGQDPQEIVGTAAKWIREGRKGPSRFKGMQS